MVTSSQILLAMLVASAIGNPIRALRRNLPSAMGIFPTRDALTIEVTGGEHKIDRFLSLIEDYDVQMLTRSGRIALPKPRQ